VSAKNHQERGHPVSVCAAAVKKRTPSRRAYRVMEGLFGLQATVNQLQAMRHLPLAASFKPIATNH
jgi:hypothetical protein